MSLFENALDDLEPGATHESPPRVISEADVAVFAALTGDRHPAHLDPDWAAAGPFGRPIAHGLLVLSCAAGSLPLDPGRVLALRRVREAVFKRPLAVGDAIAVRCSIVSTRPIDERSGLVECEWRILDAAGRLLARAVVEVLWSRRAEPPRAGAGALDSVQIADDGIHVLI
ncbi:MAG: acyl dehydratase [Acidobacteria bacterium]|nr:MAG: acyl dehydratase [Acidobacteriota bacterium]MCL4286621.1 MaoC family dehydratase N-terminal domain-containing protein [Thermoleophilia bacterium]GIK77491.1 MAG: hypothetical protein BroJett022_11810 [Actinomycetes bacterium]